VGQRYDPCIRQGALEMAKAGLQPLRLNRANTFAIKDDRADFIPNTLQSKMYAKWLL